MVEANTGIVEITFNGEKLNGSQIQLMPEKVGDTLNWQCQGKGIEKYLPKVCR